MKINKKGITRIVFIFNKIVIKIPNYSYQHSHFLQGCLDNWNERKYTKYWKNCKDCDLYDKIAPTYFCSWFGLFQIQAKCEPKLENLTMSEREIYKVLCGTDIKKENFGYLNNKLVCIDYA